MISFIQFLNTVSPKVSIWGVKLILSILLILVSFIFLVTRLSDSVHGAGIGNLPVRSVDTMKFSKDIAREKENDLAFDAVIEQHVAHISSLNVTHVAIATPFDKEFVPYLRRWVKVARKYKLKVWYRGNLSGWEGWFNYEKITPATRIILLTDFIKNNEDLFEDGDIFTSCVECENGALGFPVGSQIPAFREFTINEYNAVKKSFRDIGKDVQANYNSMNGELAKHLMDKNTTAEMDGIVAIDHYVHSQEKLVNDINYLESNSGGRIVLGEVGAPIPDIHGDMTELEQRDWLAKLFVKLDKLDNLDGINYWLSYGGSTPLWDPNGKERLAAEVVRNAFGGNTLRAKLVDRKGVIITDAEVISLGETYLVDTNGVFSLPYLYEGQTLEISAKGYPKKTQITLNGKPGTQISLDFEIENSVSSKSLWVTIWRSLTYPFMVIFNLLTGK